MVTALYFFEIHGKMFTDKKIKMGENTYEMF